MKCRVLVAEDELIERKVLCKTLQRYLGDLIFLYEAKNGREAPRPSRQTGQEPV